MCLNTKDKHGIISKYVMLKIIPVLIAHTDISHCKRCLKADQNWLKLIQRVLSNYQS